MAYLTGAFLGSFVRLAASTTHTRTVIRNWRGRLGWLVCFRCDGLACTNGTVWPHTGTCEKEALRTQRVAWPLRTAILLILARICCRHFCQQGGGPERQVRRCLRRERDGQQRSQRVPGHRHCMDPGRRAPLVARPGVPRGARQVSTMYNTQGNCAFISFHEIFEEKLVPCLAWIFNVILLVISLAFNVTIFCVGAFVSIFLMLLRRLKCVGGELGGPKVLKYLTTGLLMSLWFTYIILACLEAYDVIEGFWAPCRSAASGHPARGSGRSGAATFLSTTMPQVEGCMRLQGCKPWSGSRRAARPVHHWSHKRLEYTQCSAMGKDNGPTLGQGLWTDKASRQLTSSFVQKPSLAGKDQYPHCGSPAPACDLLPKSLYCRFKVRVRICPDFGKVWLVYQLATMPRKTHFITADCMYISSLSPNVPSSSDFASQFLLIFLLWLLSFHLFLFVAFLYHSLSTVTCDSLKIGVTIWAECSLECTCPSRRLSSLPHVLCRRVLQIT